ncbi:AsmA family protein [Candidatus Binatus sp.]|uniref:AsmA family protein n=1 Tax=Candidatus Binatus sp. TaxID=2811406 RepID=UPI003CAFD5A0
MRRVIVVAAAIVGAVVIFAGAIVFYAATNLNSIIAERRQSILDKVSTALGRQIHADDIKVSLGWGIMADVTGVQVADDPDISTKPFIEASNVYTRLQLLPLLARRIEVTEVVLDKPVIRIVQTRDGTFNVSTLGRKKVHTEEESSGEGEGGKGGGDNEESPMAQAGRAPAALGSLLVQNFSINGGTLIFQTEGAPESSTVNAIDLKVRDFGFNAPFTVAVTFAALSDQQNFDLSATIGPLINNAVIDVDAIPLSGKAKVGPILLTQLETIPMVAKAIPPKLSVSGPVTFEATADGNIQSIKFNISSDLSTPAIAFGDSFNKPADTPLKISAEGSQGGSGVAVTLANVTLGDLEAKATDIKIGGGTSEAHVDTNNFDLAAIANMIPALGKYNLTGKTEIHTAATLVNGKASADGTVALAGVGLSIPDQKAPPLSNVSGNIKLTGTSADVGPLTFNLGAQQATLKSHIDQFQPLVMSYELNAAAVRLADLAPSRPPDEVINQLFAKGAVSIGSMTGPTVDSEITSPSGNLANVPYQNLRLSLSLADKLARVTTLRVKAFSGDIVATGNTRLEASAPMEASISFTNLDLQQALDSQKSKAAGTVRGTLGGKIKVSGKTGTFDEMKPTFKGNGNLTLTNGKLVGVNIGGQALKKVQHLPAIGNLVPDAVVKNHPELFSNPDTDIQLASLTFVLDGPRITSHDVKAQTVDYNLLGDGWFDMDKNIDLAAEIVLSPQFSKELVEQKKEVAFIANKDGQIDIPLQVVGQLPKPQVLPNVTELAQLATNNAAQSQGQKYLGKIFGKKGIPKGLSKFLGGDSSGTDGSGNGSGNSNGGGNSNPPPNPLDQLKKLF